MAPRQPATAKVPVPGPGSHDVPSLWNGELKSSKVAATTSFSVPKDPNKPTPRGDLAAPGSYEVTSTDSYMSASARPGFGQEKRHLMNVSRPSATPGPEREPGDNQKFHRSPKLAFGSSPRVLRIPGGTAADPPKRHDEYQGASTEAERREKFPGPGHHDPDHSYSSKVTANPNFTNRGSTRGKYEPFAKEHTHNPGPGAYDMPEEGQMPGRLAPRPKFSTAGRMLGLEEPPKGTATSLKSSKASKQSQGSPGPGEYSGSVDSTRHGHAPGRDSAPKWSMGGRPTFDLSRGYC